MSAVRAGAADVSQVSMDHTTSGAAAATDRITSHVATLSRAPLLARSLYRSSDVPPWMYIRFNICPAPSGARLRRTLVNYVVARSLLMSARQGNVLFTILDISTSLSLHTGLADTNAPHT